MHGLKSYLLICCRFIADMKLVVDGKIPNDADGRLSVHRFLARWEEF